MCTIPTRHYATRQTVHDPYNGTRGIAHTYSRRGTDNKHGKVRWISSQSEHGRLEVLVVTTQIYEWYQLCRVLTNFLDCSRVAVVKYLRTRDKTDARNILYIYDYGMCPHICQQQRVRGIMFTGHPSVCLSVNIHFTWCDTSVVSAGISIKRDISQSSRSELEIAPERVLGTVPARHNVACLVSEQSSGCSTETGDDTAHCQVTTQGLSVTHVTCWWTEETSTTARRCCGVLHDTGARYKTAFFSHSTSIHRTLGASRLCAIQVYYWHWQRQCWLTYLLTDNDSADLLTYLLTTTVPTYLLTYLHKRYQKTEKICCTGKVLYKFW